MTEIETNNPELADTLPKNYQEVPNEVLVELIKLLDPVTLEGDAFGKVYEFMMSASQSHRLASSQIGGDSKSDLENELYPAKMTQEVDYRWTRILVYKRDLLIQMVFI